MKKGVIIAIFVAIIILISFIFGLSYIWTNIIIKALPNCGQGGFPIGSLNKGYYCMYRSIHNEYKNASECPSCSDLCISKNKTKRTGYCGPESIDLTNKIRRDPNGSFYIVDMPVECYCCCDETKN